MRQRRTLTVTAAAGIAVSTALSACSAGGDADDTYRVVAFTAGYGTPVGKSTLDEFVERGQELGWDVTLHTSDFDYDVINTDVTSSITQGVDAVVAGFPDSRQIAPLVNAANEQDVPIFSIDGGVEPNDDFVSDVTVSQEQIAELTVEMLGESMGGLEGKEVMVIGHDPHIGIMTRSDMAYDLLTEAGATITPDEVRQVLNPGTSHEEALEFVTDHLQADPDGLDGIWTGWDHAAVGAVQAVTEAGREDIPVTGVDAIGMALDEIEQDGAFNATVVQDWPMILDVLIEQLQSHADTGELPSEHFIETDVTLVTSENAADIEPTD